MKNIHILPTDKPSRLYINARYKHYEFCELPRISTEYKKCHNIYITSDEEIKRIDYWLNIDNNTISNGEMFELANDAPSCKKIILTTDQDLIKDSVQHIDDEFLEWFVKNPSCEYVDLIGLRKEKGYEFLGYEIIIPKEEPKSKLTNQKYINKIEILPEQIWNDEKMEGVKKLIQKQKLIEIIKSDEELGLYEETQNFLPGLIKQFDPKEGEINGEQWTAVHFLKWLELNKFKIVK